MLNTAAQRNRFTETANATASPQTLLVMLYDRLLLDPATAEIVRIGLPSRVLVLTTFDADRHVYESFRAGASGFLLKNAPIEQLAGAVHAIASGQTLLSADVTRRLVELHAASTDPDCVRALATLSTREREVLGLIARGLSNQDIADQLIVSLGTVKTYVARTLAKLGLRDRVQAVVFAYDSGLVRSGTHTAQR